MIGILIVTHGRFGVELLRSAELITGKQDNVKTLGLEHGNNIKELEKDVYHAIIELNHENENGVIVMTDLFVASPSNVAAANMNKVKFKCLTGVNLPMLLECIVLRGNDYIDISEITQRCIKAGVEGIKDIGSLLFGKGAKG